MPMTDGANASTGQISCGQTNHNPASTGGKTAIKINSVRRRYRITSHCIARGPYLSAQ